MGKSSGISSTGVPPGKPPGKPEGEGPERKYTLGAVDKELSEDVQIVKKDKLELNEKYSDVVKAKKAKSLKERAQIGPSDSDAKTSKATKNASGKVI